jgi:hypothetical protein
LAEISSSPSHTLLLLVEIIPVLLINKVCQLHVDICVSFEKQAYRRWKAAFLFFSWVTAMDSMLPFFLLLFDCLKKLFEKQISIAI